MQMKCRENKVNFRRICWTCTRKTIPWLLYLQKQLHAFNFVKDCLIVLLQRSRNIVLVLLCKTIKRLYFCFVSFGWYSFSVSLHFVKNFISKIMLNFENNRPFHLFMIPTMTYSNDCICLFVNLIVFEFLVVFVKLIYLDF